MSMLYPSITELVKKTGNRYSLVMVTAKRARQLVEEAEETGEILEAKPVKLAVEELAEGHIKVKLSEEAEEEREEREELLEEENSGE